MMAEKPVTKVAKDEQAIKQIIIFRVSNEEFGVAIAAVQEIIKLGTITHIPDAPSFIKGLINVRGDIVPVIDIKTRFLLPANEDVAKHIVISKQEGNLFGLIVDEVIEVLRIKESEIKSTPQLMTSIEKEYLSGVVTYEGRLIIILNLKKILAETELSKYIRASHKVTTKKNNKHFVSKADESLTNSKK